MKEEGRAFGSVAEIARLDRELNALRGLIETTRKGSRERYGAVIRAMLQAAERAPNRSVGVTSLLQAHLDAVSVPGRIAVRGPFVYASIAALFSGRRRRQHRRIDPRAGQGRPAGGGIRRVPRRE